MTFVYLAYFFIFISLYLIAISLTYMKFVEGIFIKLPGQNLSIYITAIISAILFIFMIWNFIELQQSSQQKASIIFLLIVIVIFIFLITIFYIEMRNRKIRNDEYQRKKQALIARLNENPENFGLILKMANLYHQEGNLDTALQHYKKAISLLKNPEISLKAKEKIKEIEYAKKFEEKKYPVKCPYCGTRNLRYSFRCRKCYKKLHSDVKKWIYSFINIYERIGLITAGLMFLVFIFTLPIGYAIVLFVLLAYIIFFLMH